MKSFLRISESLKSHKSNQITSPSAIMHSRSSFPLARIYLFISKAYKVLGNSSRIISPRDILKRHKKVDILQSYTRWCVHTKYQFRLASWWNLGGRKNNNRLKQTSGVWKPSKEQKEETTTCCAILIKQHIVAEKIKPCVHSSSSIHAFVWNHSESLEIINDFSKESFLHAASFYRSSEETKLERVARMNKTAIFRSSSAESLFNVHLLSAQADAGFFSRLKHEQHQETKIDSDGSSARFPSFWYEKNLISA